MKVHTDDLHLLLAALPRPLQQAAAALEHEGLLEIVMDLGRLPQARYASRVVTLAEEPVSADDLQAVSEAVGEFGDADPAVRDAVDDPQLRHAKAVEIGFVVAVEEAASQRLECHHDLEFVGG